MVFNTIFNNISVLLVEVTGLLEVIDKLYQIMFYPVHLIMSGIQTHKGLIASMTAPLS